MDISKVAHALSMLTLPKFPIKLMYNCQEGFEWLKVVTMLGPILAMHDHHLPLTLHANAFTQSLGSVLYQGEGKERQVLAYSILTLLADTRYLIKELEAMAGG